MVKVLIGWEIENKITNLLYKKPTVLILKIQTAIPLSENKAAFPDLVYLGDLISNSGNLMRIIKDGYGVG